MTSAQCLVVLEEVMRSVPGEAGHTASVPGSVLGNPWEPTGRNHSDFCVLMTRFLKLNCSAFLFPFFPV